MVQDRADAELSTAQSLKKISGPIACHGLLSLEPAELIQVNNPYVQMNDNFRVVELTHSLNFSQNPIMQTSFTVEIPQESLAIIQRDIIEKGNQATDFNNLNDMTDSIHLNFSQDEEARDIYTLTDSEIIDEVLLLVSGKSTGQLLTKSKSVFPESEIDDDINSFEIRVEGSNLSQCTYDVSNDGGQTFIRGVVSGEVFFALPGNEIVLRINLNDASGATPEMESISVLLKR